MADFLSRLACSEAPIPKVMEVPYLLNPGCDRDIMMVINMADKDWIDQIKDYIRDGSLPLNDPQARTLR